MAEVLAVTTIAPADAERAVATTVLAFATDPMARWTMVDPATYLKQMPAVVRAFGGNAFTHGTAHQVGGFSGVALWLPPDVHADEEALAALILDAAPPERQTEAAAIFEQMASYHPQEPHWYLPLISVDPTQQGRGYGAALLRHALEICDRDHCVAYLESSNPVNIPLYERHGFKRLGAIQTGSSPTLVPMLRAAR